jgi:uncharacterized OB-fold protein
MTSTCPPQRSRVERVVSVANVGALVDETLHHLEIADEGRAVQNGAIVDASHVPVAVLLEKEIDCVPLFPDVGVEQRKSNGVARGHFLVPAARARQQPAVTVEERSQQIHPPERGSREHVGLSAEGDHLLCGTRCVIREGAVQTPVAGYVEPGSVLQEHIDERSDHVGVAGLLARDEQPHRVAAVRADGQRIHVGAGVDQHSRDVRTVRRQPRTRAVEPSTVGVASYVVQQRCAGEIVKRRVEIGARVRQRWIRGEQAPQAIHVAGIHGG